MKQADIIDKLNSLYPDLNLLECEDQFCSCDAEGDDYIIEIKSRDKEYRSWIIEKKKFKQLNEKIDFYNKDISVNDKPVCIFPLPTQDNNPRLLCHQDAPLFADPEKKGIFFATTIVSFELWV